MQTLKVPEDTSTLNIQGDDYTPDADGCINVPEAHVQQALQLGCTDPFAETLIPVAPTIPAEAQDEAIAALIKENEALKADNSMLTTANDDLRNQITTLEADKAALTDDLEKAVALAEGKAAAPAPAPVAEGATESGTGAQDGVVDLREPAPDASAKESAPEAGAKE